MFKETTGAFDGARTHVWQVSTDHESDALPTVPRRLNIYFYYFLCLLLSQLSFKSVTLMHILTIHFLNQTCAKRSKFHAKQCSLCVIFCDSSCIEGWNRKGFKCYWIKKQTELFHIHPSLFHALGMILIGGPMSVNFLHILKLFFHRHL